MAGVGEVSAVVGLVATSTKLAKSITDIAIKYKHARSQIESFAFEVQTLGEVLNQLHRLLQQRASDIDGEVYRVITNVLDQCNALFSEVDSFKEGLYSTAASADASKLTFRGKTKWVFEAAELQVLQARIVSTKVNLLLMMTLQCLQNNTRFALLFRISALTPSNTRYQQD